MSSLEIGGRFRPFRPFRPFPAGGKKLLAQLVGSEQAGQRRRFGHRADQAVAHAGAAAVAYRLDVLELQKSLEKLAYPPVRQACGLAHLAPREAALLLADVTADLLEESSLRRLQIPQRLAHQTTGEREGTLVIGESRRHEDLDELLVGDLLERALERLAVALAKERTLVLVEEGDRLDEVEETLVVAPRAQPPGGKLQGLGPWHHDADVAQQALRRVVQPNRLLAPGALARDGERWYHYDALGEYPSLTEITPAQAEACLDALEAEPDDAPNFDVS